MSRKKRKRKRPGNWCWSCDRRLSNEKFSGRGHARHICRECARLGGDELAYRQAQRNLERCVNFDGFIRRRHRKLFERFLQHDNLRIRAHAEEMIKVDAVERAWSRAIQSLEDVMLDEYVSETEARVDMDAVCGDSTWSEELPF